MHKQSSRDNLSKSPLPIAPLPASPKIHTARDVMKKSGSSLMAALTEQPVARQIDKRQFYSNGTIEALN